MLVVFLLRVRLYLKCYGNSSFMFILSNLDLSFGNSCLFLLYDIASVLSSYSSFIIFVDNISERFFYY